jgi:hypothetical protein
MARASSASSFLVIFLLLVVLAQGAYVGIGLYLVPQVFSVSATVARPGDVLTIQGSNFARDPWDNTVLFGNQSAKVTKATPSAIEVVVPEVGGLGANASKTTLRVVVGSRVSAAFEIGLAVAVAAAPSPEPPSAPPTPTPATLPEPTPTVAPTPRAEPKPSLPPSTAPAGPRAADLLAEGATAESSRRFDDAAALYEKALAMEPQNAKAQAALKAAMISAAALKRAFQPNRTVVEGPEVPSASFKDFDTREVAMHKAPEVPGRLDFEVAPAHVLAGDAYSIRVYLQNQGTKPIKVASLKVTTTTNAATAGGPLPVKSMEVAPKGRVLLHDAQGVWNDGVTSWVLDTQVVSARGDSYRSQVVWK